MDGEYRIELRDVRFSGGARHFFHLRMGKMALSSATMPRVTQAGGKVSLIGGSGEVVGETAAQSSADPFCRIRASFVSVARVGCQHAGGVLVTTVFSQNEAERTMLEPKRRSWRLNLRY